MRGLSVFCGLLLAAGVASADTPPLVFSPSPAKAGEPVVMSGLACQALPVVKIDTQPREVSRQASGGDVFEVQAAGLAAGTHKVTAQCDTSPEVPATLEVAPAKPPSVLCVQRLAGRAGLGSTSPPWCANVTNKVPMETALAFYVTGYSVWRSQGDNKRIPLRLFVEGIEIKNLTPLPQGVEKGGAEGGVSHADVLWTPLKFDARKGSPETDLSRDTWAQVLRIAYEKNKPVKISIGPEGGPYWESTAEITIQQFPPLASILSGALLALLALGLLYLGATSPLLRDNVVSPSTATPFTPPFSLARHQMALWLVVVIGAFLFVTLSTGVAAATSNTALVLIGISGATGLTAIGMDKAKREAADTQKNTLLAEQTDLTVKLMDPGAGLQTQLAAAKAANPGSQQVLDLEVAIKKATERLAAIPAELAALAPTPSQGWRRDLLSDDNGYSLHRLQIAVWTVVFVGIFIVAVWHTFAMPEFDATTLGLMGISSGLYLGFKFPEKA